MKNPLSFRDQRLNALCRACASRERQAYARVGQAFRARLPADAAQRVQNVSDGALGEQLVHTDRETAQALANVALPLNTPTRRRAAPH